MRSCLKSCHYSCTGRPCHAAAMRRSRCFGVLRDWHACALPRWGEENKYDWIAIHDLDEFWFSPLGFTVKVSAHMLTTLTPKIKSNCCRLLIINLSSSRYVSCWCHDHSQHCKHAAGQLVLWCPPYHTIHAAYLPKTTTHQMLHARRCGVRAY